MRFLTRLLLVLALAALAAPAAAQEPVTLSGVFTDQDPLTGAEVTRTITLTMVFSPAVTASSVYTATVPDTGGVITIEPSFTYGDALAGSGSLILALMVGYIYVRSRAVDDRDPG